MTPTVWSLMLLASPEGGSAGLSILLFQIGAIALVFYFLVIRPQGQARKRHAEWRVEFLELRIARWLRGAAWLERKAKDLAGVAEKAIAPYIDDLPEESPWENEAAWRRLAR